MIGTYMSTPVTTPAPTQENQIPSTQPVLYSQDERVMTVTDWFLTVLVLALPLVNIIMAIVWAASSTTNLNKRNYCRAILIWAAIGLAFYAIIFAFAFSMGVNSASMN
jgi:hypothetical protein